MFKLSSFFVPALFLSTSFANDVHQYHHEIVEPPKGIGAREAGTAEEQKTADYIIKQLTQSGYTPNIQKFTFGKKQLNSQNIIVDSNPSSPSTIVLAAHYDSTAAKQGSLGATDNGAGLAALLALADTVKKSSTLNYNIRFIAFGAEETGLSGSKFYINELKKTPETLKAIKAMINFDTIAGGDFTYVHSAHTKPYRCASENFEYNHQTDVRDALLKASIKTLGEKQKYVIHPAYQGYPEGVTGAWSDHSPFACAGVPIAYVESTNFTINGKDGFDGYSQTTNPKLWDCYDAENKTACDRKTEKKWGNIWHTEFDRLDKLNTLFPQRIEQQLNNNMKVLTEVLLNAEQYLSLK